MKGYQAADARYAVRRTIIAHAVRAILLASATAMTMGRFARAFMPTIHGIAFTVLDRVSAVSARVTSNRRTYPSPRLLIRPSHVLPPVPDCLGTRPS